jgi:hypothetical protein
MDYTIRDVDIALKKHLKERIEPVRNEGDWIRWYITYNSVTEVFGKYTLPAISITSGYLVDDPIEWQTDMEDYYINTEDNTKIDVAYPKRDVLYTYRVTYLVDKKIHANYILTKLLEILPRRFCLEVVNSNGSEWIEFSRVRLVNLDQTFNEKIIYRKDFFLETHMMLKLRDVQTFTRPFEGLDPTVDDITIINTEVA